MRAGKNQKHLHCRRLVEILYTGRDFYHKLSMENDLLEIWFLIATVLTGLLCGASLDQSLKQLPARHSIGMKAFSSYAKAADLKNGVIWYGLLGVGSALTTLVSAVICWRSKTDPDLATAFYLAAAFAVCHSVCTSKAAPTYFKQKTITDEVALTKLFKRFEQIQSIRTLFITANFGCFIWVLAKQL
jgi:hypothetical protein